MKLRRLVGDNRNDLTEIADIIMLEPGLSASVVRMANSTFFGRGTPVGTILEAIQVVGMEGVQEIVTHAIASKLIGQPLALYSMTAQELWTRALACAVAAGSLAEEAGADRADAYTAGLMHGLGLLAMDRYAARHKPGERMPSSGYPLDYAPAERAWLGFSHAEAGAALLEYWSFPESIHTAVRFQLEPEHAKEHRQLSMILATARWARSLFCVHEEKIPELPSEVWLREAGVEIADFGSWLRRVRIRISTANTELRLSS
jgi:HD-like signal output (HDOD) protein